jgi:hypothetical protein
MRQHRKRIAERLLDGREDVIVHHVVASRVGHQSIALHHPLHELGPLRQDVSVGGPDEHPVDVDINRPSRVYVGNTTVGNGQNTPDPTVSHAARLGGVWPLECLIDDQFVE